MSINNLSGFQDAKNKGTLYTVKSAPGRAVKNTTNPYANKLTGEYNLTSLTADTFTRSNSSTPPPKKST